MKKNLIYAGMLLLGMTVATSCSNEESLDQVLGNGTTIQAVIENAMEARTSVNDNYQVLWTAEDAFSVFEEGTKKATLTLSDGAGTTSGKFTIDNNVTITEDMVALFPASQTLGYEFKTTYTSQETDAPMSATFADGKFTFNLLTAMVRVVVADVPAGNVSMTISSTDLILTGTATLSNGTLAVPTQGEKSVSVNFTTTEAGTLTFDVPVPVQDYTNGLSVVVKLGDTNVLNKTTNAFNAAAGKLYLFGATYVTAENAATDLQTALEACEEGDVVMLTGDAEEVTVPSLTLSQNSTAILDLNGKTLNLMGANVRSTSTYGLTNNGTLTIINGTITSSEDCYAAIYNNGILTIANSAIEAINRGVVNDGTATLDCNVVSTNSNAVCNYNTGTLNITGGTYESKLGDAEEGGIAVRMGDEDTDDAWTLNITGGTFKAPWAALYLCNNYYNLNPAGAATIAGATFEGGKADIGGAAVKNVTISSDCTLDVIKNLGTNPASWACEMNGYNLQDAENHYDEVFLADIFANGGSHTLTKSISLAETLTVAEGKEVTLALGDYTFTSTDDYAAIINNGTLTLTSSTGGKVESSYRGVVNDGTATLNCNIVSTNSNAVCNYNTGTLNITGGTYESKLGDAEEGGIAVRMGDEDTDDAWTLNITGGTFKAPWAALYLCNNYYNLNPAGAATIAGATFEGGKADIGGAAVKNVTISSDCTLDVIKNLGTNPASWACEMNGYNLQDAENHYANVMSND